MLPRFMCPFLDVSLGHGLGLRVTSTAHWLEVFYISEDEYAPPVSQDTEGLSLHPLEFFSVMVLSLACGMAF